MSKSIEVVSYGEVAAEATSLTVDIYRRGNLLLELYPEESKALRKLLKRAEKKQAERSGR